MPCARQKRFLIGVGAAWMLASISASVFGADAAAPTASAPAASAPASFTSVAAFAATQPSASTAGPTTQSVGQGAVGAEPVPPATAAGSPAAAGTDDVNRGAIRRGTAELGGGGHGQDGSTSPAMDLGRVGLALAAVISLIFFLRWGSRKLLVLPKAGNAAHLMQVVARTPLAPRQQLLLVRVGQRLMVIGDSAGKLSAIGQLTDPDEVAALMGQAQSPARPPSTPFTQLFGRIRKNFRSKTAADDDWSAEEMREADESEQRSERAVLLDTLAGDVDLDPVDDSDVDAHSSSGMPEPLPNSESAAQAAVESARVDIQSLRAKLREMTQRMAPPDAPPNDRFNADGRPLAG